jgi:hypothetical protein
VSTSKLQVVLWTLAVLFMLLHIFVQGRCLGVCGADLYAQGETLRGALDKLLGGGLQPEYWALLGFPAAAAVYAKSLTTGRAADKAAITPDEQDGGLGQATKEAAADDSGTVDLGDLQYLLFSAVTLGYVVVTFLAAPQDGFPAVPGVLVGLVGVSAGTYATKKAVETGVRPEVTEVQPATIVIGSTPTLVVRGRGFRRDTAQVAVVADRAVVTVGGWSLCTTKGTWSADEISIDVSTNEQEWKSAGLWPDHEGLDGERTADLVVIDDQSLRSPPFTVRLRRKVTP